jgi:hypothetical protein
MADPKLDLLTPASSQVIFIDQQPQMAFGADPAGGRRRSGVLHPGCRGQRAVATALMRRR